MSKTKRMKNFEIIYRDRKYNFKLDAEYVISTKQDDVYLLFTPEGQFVDKKIPTIVFTIDSNMDDGAREIQLEYTNGVDPDAINDLIEDLEGHQYVDEVTLNEFNINIYNVGGIHHSVIHTILDFCQSYFGHTNFCELNTQKPKTKGQVIKSFQIGNLELKGEVFDLIQNIPDKEGNVYVIGNFGRDINGLSLDGKYSERCCAIIPIEKVQISEGKEKEEEEEKKEEGGNTSSKYIKATITKKDRTISPKYYTRYYST